MTRQNQDENFVSVIDGALPPDLCAELIARFEACSSQQIPGRIGGGVDLGKKRSLDITLDQFPDWRPLQSRVAEAAFRWLCEYATRYHFLVIGALSPTVRHPATGMPVTLDANNFSEIGAGYVPALLTRCFRLGTMNIQKYEKIDGGYPHWHSEIFPQRGSTAALQRVLFWICYLRLSTTYQTVIPDVSWCEPSRLRIARLILPGDVTRGARGAQQAHGQRAPGGEDRRET